MLVRQQTIFVDSWWSEKSNIKSEAVVRLVFCKKTMLKDFVTLTGRQQQESHAFSKIAGLALQLNKKQGVMAGVFALIKF